MTDTEIDMTVHEVLDLALAHSTALTVATLGPAGTSSEASGRHLLDWATPNLGTTSASVQLHRSYEDAAQAVLSGAATHLLVANAYGHISRFYMDPNLAIAAAYLFNTPHYGLAKMRGAQIPSRFDVATHPSPVPLIEELLPEGMAVSEVVHMSSTSAAAAAVAADNIAVALTTDVAAAIYDLEFISTTRPIEMLWTVFARTTEIAEQR